MSDELMVIEGKTQTGQLDFKMAAAACYLPFSFIHLIAAGIFLATEPKEHRFVRFHAIQSLLVFALLLYLYERFAAPLAILTVAALAASAVFPALWLTGIELNITSMVGLTMIVGISAEASIFYMSQLLESEQGESRFEALVEAGRLRFRPIAMTALAAILALLPLALGVGQGSAMLMPLAVAIIAGLVLTVPAVLLVLPVLFGLMSRARRG